MTDATGRPLVLAEDLLAALYKSPLPFALIDVDAMSIIAANDPARVLLGNDDPELKELPLREIMGPDNRHVGEVLKLIADGAIDAYEARRQLRRSDGSLFDVHIWVQSVRELMPFAAVAVLSPDDRSAHLTSDLDFDVTSITGAVPVIVGQLDVELRILRVSSDTNELLGRRAESVTGVSFVDCLHKDDVAPFLIAVGRALSQESGVGLRVRVADANGGYARMRMLISPLAGGPARRLGFVLANAPADVETQERTADLEQRLWRIALEVQAAGVMNALDEVPADADIPATHELSSRQWEVLARLRRGERVPGIAQEMFVSQSTVRNHLAAIFRKTGVHSQAELLARMRENRHSV